MRVSLWLCFLGVCLLGVLTLLIPFGLLTAEIQKSDFKAVAEQKVAEFLSADVQIDRIRVGFLNQVSLSGLEIRSETEKEDTPYQIHVDQIVFRYRLLQLLSRNLTVPAAIVLKSPKLLLAQSELSYRFFKDLNFGDEPSGISVLELTGGELLIQVPGTRSEVRIQNIDGTIQPMGHAALKVDFEGLMSGFLSGNIRVHGVVEPLNRRHRLEFDLDSVDLTEEISVPLKSMKGKIRWVDQNITFEKLQVAVYGWESILEGSLSHYTDHPLLTVDWRIGKKYPPLQMNLKMDFESQYTEGSLKPFGEQKHAFVGKVRRESWNLFFDDLVVDNKFLGQGQLDLSSGNSQFSFERGAQRFSVNTNLKDLHFHLDFNLDHANLYGLDLVTSAEIELKPERPWSEERLWDFDGIFRTDYFILEYAPFDDFQGSFNINSFGIQNFSSSWGRVFEMDGEVFFTSSPPEGKFVLHINEFDLKGVKNFASKPLPKTLGGILEGKLKIKGILKKPEITGAFSIKDGILGKLEYDRMIIHVRGYPPYLPLEDSRILKGRTELYLRGALDLSLPNMFHGIRIETADRLVLWKGWEVSASDVAGDVEIGHVISRFPTIALKAGIRTGEAPATEAEVVQEEGYVTAGPKFRF